MAEPLGDSVPVSSDGLGDVLYDLVEPNSAEIVRTRPLPIGIEFCRVRLDWDGVETTGTLLLCLTAEWGICSLLLCALRASSASGEEDGSSWKESGGMVLMVLLLEFGALCSMFMALEEAGESVLVGASMRLISS